MGGMAHASTSTCTMISTPSSTPPASYTSPLLSDARIMPPPSTVPPRKRKALELADAPVAGPSRSPSSSASGDIDGDEEADEEYEPSPVPSGRGGKGGKRASAAKTAGSKAGNGRGMSREALRKANHSLIERRRREKINAALGNLREMVPGLGDGMSKGGEFKLEVLERTVEYMRHLRQQVVDLETRLGLEPSIAGLRPSREASATKRSLSSSNSPLPTKKSPSPNLRKSQNTSGSPPTPTPSEPPSEDPNETDAEPSLPPQFAMAHRSPPSSSAPTIASLLSGSVRPPSSAAIPASRPIAPPQANNPTLYLPFPTPSPTSPFLTYSGASSTSTTGIVEPSPFLAPMQNMGLFGGVLNLDTPEGEAVCTKGQDPSTEEAANLLLAFSSPDTLRPTPASGVGLAAHPGGRERRSTLESEEFVLDENGTQDKMAVRVRAEGTGVAGKTARDILRM